MSRDNAGKPAQKTVLKFKDHALGCFVGVPPHEAKAFHLRFPPGHRIHGLMPLMKVGREFRAFWPGSGKALCQDGMLKMAVESSERFVFCADKEQAKALGVPRSKWHCSNCQDAAEAGTVCSHDGEFWGFFGLRWVFEDVTHQGFGDMEIMAVEDSAAAKIIRQKDSELAVQRSRVEEVAKQKEDMAREIAALQAQIDAGKVELARAKARKATAAE